MSYRLSFFKGFDQATENLSDDQINQVFDALTELIQDPHLKSGDVKVGRDLWVRLVISEDTLHVAGISTRRPGKAD